MKDIKKKVRKILFLSIMVFAMAFTVVPTNVFAANQALEFSPNGGEDSIELNVVPSNSNYGQYIVTKLSKGEASYPSWSVASGELPTGMSLKGYNGYVVLTGAPSAVGTYTFALSVANRRDSKDVYTTNEFKIFVLSPIKVTKVNGGTSDKAEYAKDDIVTITANASEEGKQFKEWTVVSGDVTLANTKSATTTFTMLDSDVEVTATYEDIPHTFGDWVIDIPASETTNGSMHRDCTVCSQRETVEIPATGVKPSSPKTGDTSNTMLYLSFIALSGCVAGFGFKKKKSLNK